MSPAFIRLTNLVLALLIAAPAIPPSSLFAEAAPTPLTNELVHPESHPRIINSDVGHTTPMIPFDNDFNCGPDRSNLRCAGPTLIRRNDDTDLDKIRFINSKWSYFCNLPENAAQTKKRAKILEDQVAKLFNIMSDGLASPELKKAAAGVLHQYSDFVGSSSFGPLMVRMTTKKLGALLALLGSTDVSQHHDPGITHVVFQWLQRKDINKHFKPTLQAFIVANEILVLREDYNPSLPHPRQPKVLKANRYLPQYRDLLISQNYVQWPQGRDVDNEIEFHEMSARMSAANPTTDHESTMHDSITAILLRYSKWAKSKDKAELVALEDHFKQQITQMRTGAITLPGPAVIVMEAYRWILSEVREKAIVI